MRVTVRRSGGFANIMLDREVDTSDLHPSEAATLERLVAEARNAPPPKSAPMPDAYVFEVEIDGQRHELGEHDLSRPWRDLTEWVLSRE